MARSSTALALIFFLAFATFVSNIESRKLLLTNEGESTTVSSSGSSRISSTVPSIFAKLVLSALPKGRVPSSSPGKRGHATLENEELFRRHLARIDRILQSVPSPGVGH